MCMLMDVYAPILLKKQYYSNISTVSSTAGIPQEIIGIYIGVPISFIVLAVLCGIFFYYAYKCSQAKKAFRKLLHLDVGYSVRGEQILVMHDSSYHYLITSR